MLDPGQPGHLVNLGRDPGHDPGHGCRGHAQGFCCGDKTLQGGDLEEDADGLEVLHASGVIIGAIMNANPLP